MSRKATVLVLALLLSLSALARTRAVTQREQHPQGGTISGIVDSVDGNVIRLADGLIAVDASEAKILVGRGHEATIADIEPGMLLFAAMNANGKASMITATRFGDATLFGAVDDVDTTARTLTVLGKTVHVDDDTSFGGFHHNGDDLDLSDIVRNQLVQVQVDAVNGQLVAREILVLAPVPPQIGGFRGTVKSIGTESWQIERDNELVTVVVNAQTKIAGSPKVGDTVEVLYSIDNANQKVAISIVKFEHPVPPKVVTFQGTVKSINGKTWVIATDGADKTVTVNDRTKITPDTGAGHFVQVLASEGDDGTLTAIAILRLLRL